MAIPTFIVYCGSLPIDLVSISITVGISFCLYLITSLTVNLEFGYTGIPNFGKVLFVSVAGLIAGSLSYRLAVAFLNLKSTGDVIGAQALFTTSINDYIQTHPFFGLELFFFALFVGAAVAAAVGYLASFPAIRLREDYLGMLLLAAGQFFLILDNAYYPINGGDLGLELPNPLAWTTGTQGLDAVVALGILSLATVGVYLYAERTARSPLGRMLRAIRDNDISSNAIGKNTVGVRRNTLIIASAISGIVGVLFILYAPAVNSLTFTRTVWTFYPFVIVILGGAANNLGVAIGSFVFVGITETMAEAANCVQANGLSLPVDINALIPIFVGSLLIIILLWRPKGLIKERPSYTISKSKLQDMYDKANKVLTEEKVPIPVQSTVSEDKTKPETSEGG